MAISNGASDFKRLVVAGIAGLAIGLLGGLIGLGGAEFRLPLLIGVFGFPALDAVIVNKATSLIVIASALVSRSQSIPFDAVMAQWPTMATLLIGSLAGAWVGADWATRVRTAVLYRVIAVLLILIASCFWRRTMRMERDYHLARHGGRWWVSVLALASAWLPRYSVWPAVSC